MIEPEKVVLITGSSSGFGLLTAVECAERGHRVIASMREPAKQLDLLNRLTERGLQDRVTITELDVTNEEQVQSIVNQSIAKFGHIDVLVNNAGYAVGGFVEDVPLEAWRAQFETNVFGAIAVTRAVLPHMRQRGHGRIINVSSISGRLGFPGLGPYSASKFALEGFSESLRFEMAPYGVEVVLVEPASYRTPVWDKGLASSHLPDDSPFQKQAKTMTATVRQLAEHGGDPQEVADCIANLVTAHTPPFRIPLGKGVQGMLLAKTFLPWKWIERTIAKRFEQ